MNISTKNPLDKVFDDAHRELVGTPYVPRMNRRWEEKDGCIRAVTDNSKALKH